MKHPGSREEIKFPAEESLTPIDFIPRNTQQTPENITLLTDPTDSQYAPAISKSNFEPKSESKQLKSTESWYGSWSRKSTTSIKVATDSKLNESNCNEPQLDGWNIPKSMAPDLCNQPSIMSPEKSNETIGIIRTSQDDRQNKFCDLQSSNSNVNSTDLSVHLDEDVTATTSESDQSLLSSDVAVENPVVYSSWFGSWLGIPITQKASENIPEPNTETPSQDRVESSSSTVLPKSGLLHSPIHAKDSLTLKKSITMTDDSSSWYQWSLTHLFGTHEQKASVETYIPVHNSNITKTPSKDSPVVKPSRPITGSSWSSCFRGYKFQLKDPNKINLAGSNEIDIEISDSLNSRNNISKQISTSRTVDGNDNKISQTINTLEKNQPLIDKQLKHNVQMLNPKAKPLSNLILPPLRSTYQEVKSPSTLEKITRLFQSKNHLSAHRIFLSAETPKLSKVLVIGVHGLFPAPFLRTVIGQPTGTSDLFVNYAADAVRRWAKNHGAEGCEIEKVALEGGGKILDRVENLWKILLNWINYAREADFILVACHSQGVPVAMILISRLIELGVVSTCKIGVCAMAGVSLGPFVEFKYRLIGGSPGELFDFADPESHISKIYKRSLGISVQFGVRILFCGSIDDQLVSLESSTFSTVSHPYIYRAVFIDGRLHNPDFLTDLVGLALKLRNVGISDHGLIRELSASLAGSLYTGEGHSRLYSDIKVYDLAVEFALETTSVGDVPIEVRKGEISASTNPYMLPWIMRGLLEEEYVRTKLINEITELLEKFDAWKPATKLLKDIKYRLEPVRSKL